MNNKVSYFALPGIKPMGRRVKFDVVEGDKIIKVVCEHFNTDFEKLKRKIRFAETVLARNALYHFLYMYTTLNKAQIGRMFNMDHTTVIHGMKTFENRMDVEEAVKKHVDEIKRKLFEE